MDTERTVTVRSRDMKGLNVTPIRSIKITDQDAEKWIVTNDTARKISGSGFELHPLRYTALTAMSETETCHTITAWLRSILTMNLNNIRYSTLVMSGTGRTVYHPVINGEHIWVSEPESIRLYIDLDRFLGMVVLSHSRLAWVYLSSIPQLEAYEIEMPPDVEGTLIVAQVEMLSSVGDGDLSELRQNIDNTVAQIQNMNSVIVQQDRLTMELANLWQWNYTNITGWRRSNNQEPYPIYYTLYTCDTPQYHGHDIARWLLQTKIRIYNNDLPVAYININWNEITMNMDGRLRLTYITHMSILNIIATSNPYLDTADITVGTDHVVKIPACSMDDVNTFMTLMSTWRDRLPKIAVGDVNSNTGEGSYILYYDGRGMPLGENSSKSAKYKCWWTGDPSYIPPIAIESDTTLRPCSIITDSSGAIAMYDNNTSAQLVELRTLDEPNSDMIDRIDDQWKLGTYITRWGHYCWNVLQFPTIAYNIEPVRRSGWRDV